MKESSLHYKTISNRLKEDNDMSSVPLMTLHNSKGRSDESHDSDQISDEDDDPLESVLARMKYRPHSYRPQDFWSGLMFAGFTCLVLGFVISYVIFLTIDQNNRVLQTIEYDANPKVASGILQEISASNISKFASDLSSLNTGNVSQNLRKALMLQQHFSSLGFDSVSPVVSSEVILSYYDRNRDNLVAIAVSKENSRDLYGITDGNDLVSSEGFPVTNSVEGTVLYVNFGRESDFQYLENEISDFSNTKGTSIFLARLGKVPPIELVHRCLTKGALGVILFADPQQFPVNSKTRNKYFLTPSQLGTLQSMHGNAAIEGTDHTKCIPVQTISADDAKSILKEMSSGQESPESWIGKMDINYSIGPGFSVRDGKVNMTVNMINIKKTYYSITGGIRGNHEPDRYVLLGSSHGSLSEDNTLGATASMMEVARVFSVLKLSKGWRPRRSIMFCSWGFNTAEGTNNSMPLTQEWGHLMNQRAVAYLNVNVPVKGTRSLSVTATPLLSKVVYDASTLVPNPNLSDIAAGRLTLFDSWLHTSPSLSNPKKPKINNIKEEGNFQSILLDLGVPSLDLHFTNAEADTSFFNDTNFRYHKAVTQLWAILTWRLADSLVVPFDISQYTSFLNDSVDSVGNHFEKVVKSNALPVLQLESALLNFTTAAETFEKKIHQLDKSNSLAVRIMNDQQLQIEKAFIHQHSHPVGSVFRHMIFSPGASVNVNNTAGFGILQDLLDDLGTSQPPDLIRAKVQTHLDSLTHCIASATHNLQIPLHLPTL